MKIFLAPIAADILSVFSLKTERYCGKREYENLKKPERFAPKNFMYPLDLIFLLIQTLSEFKTLTELI